ncbi:MAG: universal stress protein [Deltaproteobacteria bacterium]|jgi:nucleotide-binding universal stress UspA family protein|nr:universal stress protein [Deltaproteobacteria bacterium]
MGLFEKILVPVDGSRHSLNAVCLAARLSQIHGSELRIFHVIDETILDQLVRFSDKERETVRDELKNSAHAFLSDMRCEAQLGVVTASEIIIREGIPHEVILHEAASWGADLIVIGKLGRRGIAHILLGSVAERVIEFSDVPVLTVK